MCNDLARNLWIFLIIAPWTVSIHAKCFKFKKSCGDFSLWYRCCNRNFRIFQALELFAWEIRIRYNGIFNRNNGWNIEIAYYENNLYNPRFMDSMHYFSFSSIYTNHCIREKIQKRIGLSNKKIKLTNFKLTNFLFWWKNGLIWLHKER